MSKLMEQLSTGGYAFTHWRQYLDADHADRILSASNSRLQWGTRLETSKYVAYDYGRSMLQLEFHPALTERREEELLERIGDFLDTWTVRYFIDDVEHHLKSKVYDIIQDVIGLPVTTFKR